MSAPIWVFDAIGLQSAVVRVKCKKRILKLATRMKSMKAADQAVVRRCLVTCSFLRNQRRNLHASHQRGPIAPTEMVLAAPSSGSGDVIDNGVLAFFPVASTNTAFSQNIPGTGAVSFIGDPSTTVTLTGTTTYAGGMIVGGGGRVLVSSDLNFGAESGPLFFQGGTGAEGLPPA